MAETAAQLNTFIDACVTTRLSITESMVDGMTTAESTFKHLQIDKLTKQISDAESKVKSLNSTAPRFRPIRMYPVK